MDLYFLIHAIIVHVFNPVADLVIPKGLPIKQAKAELEIHPVTVEDKIRKCSI